MKIFNHVVITLLIAVLTCSATFIFLEGVSSIYRKYHQTSSAQKPEFTMSCYVPSEEEPAFQRKVFEWERLEFSSRGVSIYQDGPDGYPNKLVWAYGGDCLIEPYHE